MEIEFQLGKFFHTSPYAFIDYDYKSFIWQYDRMIETEKKGENTDTVNFINKR